jgi:choline dehydrogenase-like flavoprotein
MDQFISGRDLAGGRASPIGKTAVVVGAGIAGLTAAGALADWLEQVVVLDRDPLPDSPMHRLSTPQSRHSHELLVGGLLAQDALFPGIAEDFAGAGAVPVRINRDLREEPAHRDPMPQRDFGQSAFAMSRPLIEFTLRRRGGTASQRHVPAHDPGDRFDQGTKCAAYRWGALHARRWTQH